MRQFDLSPDGKMMVDLTTFEPEPNLALNQQGVRLFNLETRQTSILKQGDSHETINWVLQPFSPDSRYLCLTTGQGTNISLIEVQTGKEVILLDTKKAGSISWVVWAQ